MAVAIKTNPDARPSSTPPNPAVLSLLGVVYVVLSLVLLFKLVPEMWWTVWNGLQIGSVQLARFPVIGGSLLLIFSLFLAMALIGLGNRLLGPNPPAGTRAGVFVGFVGLLLVLLLTRWISIGLERMAYAGTIDPMTGAIATGVIAGALLFAFIRFFVQKSTQKSVVGLEEMGWFSMVAYKPSQGQRVRRGTIFGILLLVGAGVYTMLHHNTLRRVGPDWTLNVPFTGAVALDGWGDARDAIKDKVAASSRMNVEVRYPGASELRLKSGQVMTLDAFKVKFNTALKSLHFSELTQAEFAEAEALDPLDYIAKVNDFVYAEFEDLLSAKKENGESLLKADIVRRLRVLDNETEMADLNRLMQATAREVDLARNRAGASEDTVFLGLPVAAVLVNQYAMKDVWAATSPDRAIRIESAGDSKFKDQLGQVVSKEEFDAEVERLSTEQSRGLGLVPPEGTRLRQPYGPVVYHTLTLLPSIQYTVPLLLILGGIWLGWRLVNVPAFADFLIATDGEMNKVSWTTQKKLVQDTIVVLVTVVLMAVFLFVVDYGWKLVLQPLGVLHIPKVNAEQQKQIEQKKW